MPSEQINDGGVALGQRVQMAAADVTTVLVTLDTMAVCSSRPGEFVDAWRKASAL